jgi:hypothetical protein
LQHPETCPSVHAESRWATLRGRNLPIKEVFNYRNCGQDVKYQPGHQTKLNCRPDFWVLISFSPVTKTEADKQARQDAGMCGRKNGTQLGNERCFLADARNDTVHQGYPDESNVNESRASSFA